MLENCYNYEYFSTNYIRSYMKICFHFLFNRLELNNCARKGDRSK